MPITAETVIAANRSPYRPDTLPAVFSQSAGSGGGLRSAGALPDPAVDRQERPAALTMRVPPEQPVRPYRIGIGDVLVLATPAGGSSVEELSGLLAAQNRRQEYVVQDDGAISIPDVGRIMLAGETVDEANEMVFQALVENQIEPAFSLEVSGFNSQRVSIGGAVRTPAVLPVDLRPIYLDEALSQVGGPTVAEQDYPYTTVRIYRDGELYQIPLSELYSRRSLQRIRLNDGDSVFVDTDYDLERAQAYFREQIQLTETRRAVRRDAVAELETEIVLRRAELEEQRDNFLDRIDLDAVDRDYVYLAGEVTKQRRFPLPFDQRATLADAVYAEGGIPTITGNIREIYVLRGATDPRDFASITAWKLDALNAASLLLAARFELRPDDVIFVSEQPVTRWNRTISQITPGLLNSTINALAR
ncbi:sugar transporter [Tropicimonas sp. IMCC6043]|nr:sugar transporter [Tropicimonas sp. IMCC6043]